MTYSLIFKWGIIAKQKANLENEEIKSWKKIITNDLRI